MTPPMPIALDLFRGTRPQPAVSSYFDEDVFRTEQQLVFGPSPCYVGHTLSVREPGDYCTLAQEGEGRVLIRTPEGVHLMSNVCRHRQSIMLRGSGNTRRHVVCPLHRWTYELDGELAAAPHFDNDPCLHLARYPLQEWNGLLFEGGGHTLASELSQIGPHAALDFTGFVHDRSELHHCRYNWKTFIEVYLEDYHVGPFHPGLGAFVTCSDLKWEFGRAHSVQTVGVHHDLERPGSPVYRRWHDALLAFREGRPPEQGAIWLTCYPTVMVEWYPHVLVVSTLFPKGPRETMNLVQFFYPEEIAAFEREFVEAHQAAYMETCVEDDEIGERMDAGRLALHERGADEAGPYQSPMEDGMQHFHAWYRRAMGGALVGAQVEQRPIESSPVAAASSFAAGAVSPVRIHTRRVSS